MGHPKTKSEAFELAHALLERMDTSGWSVNVWHNLWWCYSLSIDTEIGHLSLTEWDICDTNKYVCLLGDQPSSGLAIFTDKESYDDPNDAVSHTIEKAHKKVLYYQEVIDSVENVLRGGK